MSIDYFQRLGREIEATWNTANHNEDTFAEIASKALKNFPAHEATSPIEVLKFASDRTNLRQQLASSSAFGEPPITMFHSMDGFVIDVYFWFEGTTSVHQHGFSGAFQVLSGSSLHASYAFELERKVNARFRLGTVRPGKAEILNVGDVRTILSGPRFAHSLFHLDSPSTTVVIRTGDDIGAAPQLEYFAPYLALDPFNPLRRRALSLESLQTLRRLDAGEYERSILDTVRKLDLEETYFLLQAHLSGRRNEAEADELSEKIFEIARERHGTDVMEKLHAVLDNRLRAVRIIGLRERSTNLEHRFLLAVLLNAQTRSQVIEMMRGRYPGVDPAEKFVAILKDMMATKVPPSNALGIEIAAEALPALQLFAEGCVPADLPRLLVERGLSTQADVEEIHDELLDFQSILGGLPVLAALLK